MAARKKNEPKDAALPDSVEDRTNIGERDVAGESTIFEVTTDPETTPPPPPVPATNEDEPIPVVPRTTPPPPTSNEPLITVTGTLPDGKIALAEVNVRHPNGQVVIIGSLSAEVAPTQRVMDAISHGKLTRLS